MKHLNWNGILAGLLAVAVVLAMTNLIFLIQEASRQSASQKIEQKNANSDRRNDDDDDLIVAPTVACPGCVPIGGGISVF